MVLSVLEQFGRPEALAARYHAPRALIGLLHGENTGKMLVKLEA